MPSVIYVAISLPGFIRCPVDANPPVTLVKWKKDGLPLRIDKVSWCAASVPLTLPQGGNDCVISFTPHSVVFQPVSLSFIWVKRFSYPRFLIGTFWYCRFIAKHYFFRRTIHDVHPQYPGWSQMEDGSIRVAEVTEDSLGTYSCMPYNALGSMGWSPPAPLVLKVLPHSLCI